MGPIRNLLKDSFAVALGIAIVIIIVSIAALVTKAYPAMQTDQELFEWTIQQLNKTAGYSIVEGQHTMPKVFVVSRKEFREVFRARVQKDYKRWIKEIGKERADYWLKTYADMAIGLYLSRSTKDPPEIYILSTLGPCKQKAIKVHEFVHCFQDEIYGETNVGSIDNAREVEAHKLQKMYEAEFCIGKK